MNGSDKDDFDSVLAAAVSLMINPAYVQWDTHTRNLMHTLHLVQASHATAACQHPRMVDPSASQPRDVPENPHVTYRTIARDLGYWYPSFGRLMETRDRPQSLTRRFVQHFHSREWQVVYRWCTDNLEQLGLLWLAHGQPRLRDCFQ